MNVRYIWAVITIPIEARVSQSLQVASIVVPHTRKDAIAHHFYDVTVIG